MKRCQWTSTIGTIWSSIDMWSLIHDLGAIWSQTHNSINAIKTSNLVCHLSLNTWCTSLVILLKKRVLQHYITHRSCNIFKAFPYYCYGILKELTTSIVYPQHKKLKIKKIKKSFWKFCMDHPNNYPLWNRFVCNKGFISMTFVLNA